MAARSLLRLESRPLSRALLKAKVPMETRVLMIVMATSNSIKVKPRIAFLRQGFGWQATRSSINVNPKDLQYFVFCIFRPAVLKDEDRKLCLYLVFLIPDTRYQILDTLWKGINFIVCQLLLLRSASGCCKNTGC